MTKPPTAGSPQWHKQIKKMDATTYNKKRDDLIGLMDKVIGIEGVKAEETELFKATQRKLVANQFNIVLIGEFQGGKSTTFNALCGGREISPRGAMTKTSAVCMTATNLPDPEQKEYAEVQWKTPEELRDMISEVVKFIPMGKEESFDITNDSHREKLREQVKLIQEQPTIPVEIAEIVRIAQIVLAFYGNTDLDKYRKEKRYTIEEIAKIAVFPSDWEERWGKVGTDIDSVRDNFEVKDVLFAFVSDIQIYIHSDSLARLGCSITDCPGLFASQFDTKVAIRAMDNANAVIYLLGNKAIGESDKKSITEVMRETSLRNKVFFALNQKDNDTLTQNVIRTDKATIRNMGFGDVTITNFNALLFFLSEFGKAKLNGKIDDYSLGRFKAVAKANGSNKDDNGQEIVELEPLWCAIVRSCGQNNMGNGIDADNVAIAHTASRRDEVIDGIENNIVSQKARSILIDNGANKIKNSLDGIASRLKKDEELAEKSVEERNAEFEKAKEAYYTFKKRADEILETAFPTARATSIAKTAFDEIFTDSLVDRIATRIIGDISSNLNFFQRATMIVRKKEDKDVIVRPIIKSAMEKELEPDIHNWVSSMVQGNHETYKTEIQPDLEDAVKRIKREWKEIYVGNNPLLDGYTINVPYVDNPAGFMVSDDVIDKVAKAVSQGTFQSIGSLISTIVSTIMAFFVGTIIDFWVSGGIVTIILTVIGFITGKSVFDKNKTRNQIKDSLNTNFRNHKGEIIGALQTCPENIFTSFRKYYDRELSQKGESLEKDIEQKRADQATGEDHLREVAANAKRIREEQIEPLSGELAKFIESCDC